MEYVCLYIVRTHTIFATPKLGMVCVEELQPDSYTYSLAIDSEKDAGRALAAERHPESSIWLN